MYNVRLTVGNFFEQKVMQLFDLTRTDPLALGVVPDLRQKDNSFWVEVKSSAYNNGGVIKQRQLYGFDENISARRFYAFVYHSIGRNMQRDYPTERRLRNALGLKSLFLFPFSIVKSHFKNSSKRNYSNNDYFVQLRESLAIKIFDGDLGAWQHLGLKSTDYKRAQPHEKVHILTREEILQEQILSFFSPEFL